MKKALLITGVLFLIGTRQVVAQSPVFSQYYSSGLYLNPALAGLEKDVYLGMNYRSQWSKLNMPFSTFQFSFIMPVVRKNTKQLGSLGLSLLNDKAGANDEFVTRSASLTAAYNIHLNRSGTSTLALAAQAGIIQQQLNDGQFQWSSQYEPGKGFDPSLAGERLGLNNNVMYPIVNAGVMWSVRTKERTTRKPASIFNGLSVSYINRPETFFADASGPTAMLIKVHGGITMTIDDKLDISPNYLIQYQNSTTQINVGSYMGYSLGRSFLYTTKRTKVILGAWYRLQDAFIVSTGFSNPIMNIGFSYDTNVSSMHRVLGSANAYEISLAYKIVKNKSLKRFSSPLI